jgi:hypothetical protein
MVVIDEFRHGPAEVALPKRNHPIETFLFNRHYDHAMRSAVKWFPDDRTGVFLVDRRRPVETVIWSRDPWKNGSETAGRELNARNVARKARPAGTIAEQMRATLKESVIARCGFGEAGSSGEGPEKWARRR